MLNSLNIHNYRTLKKLQINSLGRVNLITGKNNTGKSTILEAIAVYASKGDLNLIYQFLGERGENFKGVDSIKNPVENNLKSLSSLFTGRIVGFDNDNVISIGSIDETLFGQEQSIDDSVTLRFVKYLDEILRDNQGNLLSRKRKILKEVSNDEVFKVGIEVRTGDNSHILSLEEDRPLRYGIRNLNLGVGENFQFIRTRNIDREINGKLFDNITLTEKEVYVIEALKIIEPSTDRIAFIDESSRERTAVIKLSNISGILPLRSMGDGINRILTIILALVNCDDGYLLIDEFENGLHHSVQEQLWKIVFKLSAMLNIQVFATTHSEDCITSFENVLNGPENNLEGKLIRLDNIDGIIKQVEFSADELKIATDLDIETR